MGTLGGEGLRALLSWLFLYDHNTKDIIKKVIKKGYETA